MMCQSLIQVDDASSGFISFISTNPNLLQEVVDGLQSLPVASY